MFTEVVSVKCCVKTFFWGGGLIVSDGLMALNCEKWMEKRVFSFAVPCFVVTVCLQTVQRLILINVVVKRENKKRNLLVLPEKGTNWTTHCIVLSTLGKYSALSAEKGR